MRAPFEFFVVLLLAGHALADFVFQTRWLVTHKRASRRALVLHALEVIVVQAVVLLPFVGEHRTAVAALAGVGLLHGLIDALKIAAERRWGALLRWFVLDQALHVAVIFAAAYWLAKAGVVVSNLATDPHRVAEYAAILGIYAFNVNGGSAIVAATLAGLRGSEVRDKPAPEFHAGHTIGILERMAMLSLVWLGQWSALGFVLTAKSVARFKELENQGFAETYLVGTLTSFLVAGASGLLLRAITS